jgi:hypothetical protein
MEISIALAFLLSWWYDFGRETDEKMSDGVYAEHTTSLRSVMVWRMLCMLQTVCVVKK